MAEAWGLFVAGLTVLPPVPGPVEFRLQVLGVEAGDGLRDARVVGRSDGTVAPFQAVLEPCGVGCFAGRATIAADGRWQLEITIEPNRGSLAVAAEVPLPAPAANEEFARAVGAMQGLAAVRMEERLQGATDGPMVVSRYQ